MNHYIAISDTPAFKVAKMNVMADLKNWTAFVGLQVEWSLIQRTVERELVPMANDFGMKALDEVSRLEKEFPYSFYESANDVIFGGTQNTIIR